MHIGPRALTFATPIVIVGFIAGLSVAAYQGLTHNVPGANDFFVPWRATQALFLEGRNPYSADVTRDIQITLFGHPREPTEHQFAYAYPLPVSLLLAPLVLLPYDAAEAVWLSICLTVLVVSIFFLADRQPPLLLAVYVLFGFLFYPSARSLILGQFVIVVFGAIVVALWALGRAGGFDELAGVMLALASLKPQVMFLTIPVVLLWALHAHRWKVVIAFAVSLAVSSMLAALLLPTWPADFLDSLRAYDTYVEPNSPTAILLGNTQWTFVADAVLIGALVVATWQDLRRGWPNLAAIIAFSLIVAQIVAPRTSTTNQIVMLIAIIAWLKVRPQWQQLMVMCILIVVPWAVFLLTLRGNEEQPAAFLAVPLICLAVCTTRLGKRLTPTSLRNAQVTL